MTAEGEGVEAADGLIRLALGTHGQEPIALGFTAGSVFHDLQGGDISNLREQVQQLLLGGGLGKIAHIQHDIHF